jgi:hypothetical protein
VAARGIKAQPAVWCLFLFVYQRNSFVVKIHAYILASVEDFVNCSCVRNAGSYAESNEAQDTVEVDIAYGLITSDSLCR